MRKLTEVTVLQRVAGKDASKQFWKYHNESILKKYQKDLQIGSLDSKPKAAAPPTPPKTPEAAPLKETTEKVPGPVDALQDEEVEAMDPFGDLIPYADPSWYQSYHTPYFNQSHADLRAEVREWMESDVMPYVTEWDEAKKVPDSIYKAMGDKGYLAGLLGMHTWPKHVTNTRVKSVAPEKWDLFHSTLR